MPIIDYYFEITDPVCVTKFFILFDKNVVTTSIKYFHIAYSTTTSVNQVDIHSSEIRGKCSTSKFDTYMRKLMLFLVIATNVKLNDMKKKPKNGMGFPIHKV